MRLGFRCVRGVRWCLAAACLGLSTGQALAAPPHHHLAAAAGGTAAADQAAVTASADTGAAVAPLRALPASRVVIADAFWAPRQRINRQRTIPHLIAMCQQEGRVRNLLRAGGQIDGDFEGTRTHDADLFKVIEAAAESLAVHPDPHLQSTVDRLIDAIAAAQRRDGFLHSYRQVRSANEADPQQMNLFAAGHLLDAAVAYEHATGKRSLLEVAVRLADLVESHWGPQRMVDVPPHTGIETALMRLAAATGDDRYRMLATFFIDQRGKADHSGRRSHGLHSVDHLAARELTSAEGHVIITLFLLSGMWDVGQASGDRQLLTACQRVLDDAIARRMYLTGGMGRQSDERFTEPFALDNRTAIGEGCQSAALIRLAHQFSLQMHGSSPTDAAVGADARYADLIERVMYNNLAANVSLDGTHFYYHNRLSARREDATGRPYTGTVTETDKRLMPRNTLDRQQWFKVPCCPPNVAMTIAGLGRYAYAASDGGIYINQYVAGTATFDLPPADDRPPTRRLRLVVDTRYPWDGRIRIAVHPEQAQWQGGIYLRIPDWCRNLESTLGLYRFASTVNHPQWTVQINGRQQASGELRKGYLAITRRWRPGDRIELNLAMPVRQVVSRPEVTVNRDRVALQRGPVVYCVEACDHGGRTRDLVLPDAAEFIPEHRPDLLGGITVLQGRALRQTEGAAQPVAVPFLAVPYAVWGNRDVGEMDVWLVRDPAPP